MPRKPTQQAGAQAERDAIRAFLRRRQRGYEVEEKDGGERLVRAIDELQTILEWLAARGARYRSKPGGLGREPKPTTKRAVRQPEEW